MQAHECFQHDTVPRPGNRRTNRELSIRFHLVFIKKRFSGRMMGRCRSMYPLMLARQLGCPSPHLQKKHEFPLYILGSLHSNRRRKEFLRIVCTFSKEIRRLPGVCIYSPPAARGNLDLPLHIVRLPAIIKKARRLSAKSPRFLVGLNGLEPSTFTMST